MLPSECPNCGHLHQDANFNTCPGPAQDHLAKVARAALALLDAYEEENSNRISEQMHDALRDAEEAGLIHIKVVVKIGEKR